MGGTTFNFSSYNATLKATKGGTHFVNTSYNTKKLPDVINPLHKNKAGIITRESFDLPGQPESRGVVCQFDVTGSMSHLPPIIVQNLGQVITQFKLKNILPGVHFMSIAGADSYGDEFPVQATQFETGNEIEQSLLQFVLGGGGGGFDSESYRETYGLAMLFAARYSNMDCLNKRGEKGFYFIIGDEYAYSKVTKAHAKEYLGIELETDLTFEDILAELQQKFEVFWLYPREAPYFNGMPAIHKHWQDVFGANYVELEEIATVAQVIVGLVATAVGVDEAELNASFTSSGVALSTVTSVNKSIAAYRTKTGSIKQKVEETGLVLAEEDKTVGVATL